MRKLLVTLDDELAKELAKYPNQNEIVRQALRLYIGDITTETVAGIRKSYQVLLHYMKESDSKLDYIARKVDNPNS